jgi:hypothetical protein
MKKVVPLLLSLTAIVVTVAYVRPMRLKGLEGVQRLDAPPSPTPTQEPTPEPTPTVEQSEPPTPTPEVEQEPTPAPRSRLGLPPPTTCTNGSPVTEVVAEQAQYR